MRPIDGDWTTFLLHLSAGTLMDFQENRASLSTLRTAVEGQPTLTPQNEPLTIEQLREMDGKPVWVQNLEEPEKSQWRLCHWVRGKYLVLQGITVQGYLEEDYGERWLAYAYPPAHIDLEAWTAEWVDNDESEEMMCKCSKCGYPVSYFWGKTGFCPGCGKAMTPEALAMLEKRLRG